MNPIKEIVKDSFEAVREFIDPKRRNHCFELFGFDFLMDSNYKI